MLSWNFLEIDAQLGIINFNFMDYILLSIVGGLRIGDTASSTPTAANDNYLQGSLTVSQVVSNRQQVNPGGYIVIHVFWSPYSRSWERFTTNRKCSSGQEL